MQTKQYDDQQSKRRNDAVAVSGTNGRNNSLLAGKIVQRSWKIVIHIYQEKLDFGTREQKLLKKVLNASLQRMIKEPIQELKHLETRQEQADYKKMVEQLFGIETKKGNDL